MGASIPISEWLGNRLGNDAIPRLAYSQGVDEAPDRTLETTLSTNVRALMRHHWKEENLNRLARDAEIGLATAQRIKDAKTSTRIDVVQRVARVFQLEAWQVLIPDLDPTNVPVRWLSSSERDLYQRIKEAALALPNGAPT